MLAANSRLPNNGFTFLLFYTYTKVPDMETSGFATGACGHCCTTKSWRDQTFQLIQISNFHDGRSVRWHGLIYLVMKFLWPLNPKPDSFRQHFEIH